jgi:hypothetical protein
MNYQPTLVRERAFDKKKKYCGFYVIIANVITLLLNPWKEEGRSEEEILHHKLEKSSFSAE